jgi:hypothetical protein
MGFDACAQGATMSSDNRGITRRDCLFGFAGFSAGLVSAASLFLARRHAHGIKRVLNNFAVHASYQSPSLNGRCLFPSDDPWNTDISHEPVDPNSATLIASIGADSSLHPDFGTTYNGEPWGIPYVLVPGNQPNVKVKFTYADESDPGPYPIPPDAPIEGGPSSDGDRHVIVIDKHNWVLYELYNAFPGANGTWRADAGAIFDLKKKSPQRPIGWTSCDAAGLPVMPGLIRYDEVVGECKLTHAIRFTAQRTRRAFVYPASHFASRSQDPNLPPMGMRVRLKTDYDIDRFTPECRVILQGLKTYGMILADNGGPWFITGAPDSRWNDSHLNLLKHVQGSDFEVVRMGKIETH